VTPEDLLESWSCSAACASSSSASACSRLACARRRQAALPSDRTEVPGRGTGLNGVRVGVGLRLGAAAAAGDHCGGSHGSATWQRAARTCCGAVAALGGDSCKPCSASASLSVLDSVAAEAEAASGVKAEAISG
jgi:hypothetical protein